MSNTSALPRPLAYHAYEALADDYAAHIDTKPHNAYYERPTMLQMWPAMEGRRVLDAGCGPGVYAELLIARGASVIAVDCSDRMVELATARLGSSADVRNVDLSQPLDMFADGAFDFVNAPLCVDYIGDWRALFREFHRVLQPAGLLQFSCGHPAFDAEYYATEVYFGVEQVTCTWKGFGKPVEMPSFRRSLQEVFAPLLAAGFVVTQVVEPQPTEAFRTAYPVRYASLMRRPAFLCVQARRG